MITKKVLVLSLLVSSTVYAGAWDFNNNPELLNTPWHPTHYTYSFKNLPLEGAVPKERAPWADSYWPKQRAAMAYRWQMFSTPDQNQDLSAADRQRLFFNYKLYTRNELLNMSQDEINKLSPLEKYSIYIGDYGYGAVREYQRKNNGSRAYWEGYCHAWSAVALDYPEPSPVVRTNRDGIRVPFGSADVKALLTANYAEKFGFSMSNLFGSKVQRRQVGLKCGNKFQYSTSKMRKGVEVMTDYSDTDGAMDSALEEKVREYQTRAVRVYGHQNGTAWIQQNMPEILDSNLASEARQGAEDPACLDTNAGAFHVIMANQLGIMKQGFIFDKTRDLEIWNQPAYKFESTLVGEEKPTSKSTPGTVSVKVMKSSLYYADDSDYGWAYYFPTLTSLFKGPEVNFMNEYNRYQQLLINQGDQTEPKAYPDGIIDSANYEYKLDLDATGKIIGGDWLTLDRPDFIWIMQKQGFMGRFSRLDEIYEPVRY